MAADGFFHPANEQELVSLVEMAYQQQRQLRVRGAVHSPSHVVYPDPLKDLPNRVNWQTPPQDGNIAVELDRYRDVQVIDTSRKLVAADAGIHLGTDPSDPTGTSNLETSLLWRLWERGWTLSNVGGITHQTVSGFTATGSSGASVQYSANDNLWGFRLIDGMGNLHDFSRDDPDPDQFYAMAPNLGLLGVVSKIILQCEDAFNISGQEAITTVEECAVDLFGPGTPTQPSLEQFLRDAEYARVEWWPQRGAERVQLWQAQRIPVQPNFHPAPYREFTAHAVAAQVLISLLYSILGNLNDLSLARPQLDRTFQRVDVLLDQVPALEKLGPIGSMLAKILSVGTEFGALGAIEVLKPFAGLIEREIPRLFPKLLQIFVGLDSEKKGVEKGQPQHFRDYAWHGLPMDNAADDELLPIEFTEIWVPLPQTQKVMQLLRAYFTAPDPHEAYRRTGLSAWELYAAKPNPFWMSASHTTGEDEWKDGAFRVDPYWFGGNHADPSKTFYPQFWELLRDEGIPFRLHWGKYQPDSDPSHPGWVNFFRAQYPRWDAFLRLRAGRDPAGIFLTSYWRDRFGLWGQVP